MQSSLYEQLAAAQATLKTHADTQQKLSQAQARAGTEIRRLEKLKVVAKEKAEAAAQVGARRLMGEATDKEAEDAAQAAHDALLEAAGVDHAVNRLNRESELVSERYQAAVPEAVAAQNVCNQIRVAILLESADEAAAVYLQAANAMRDALVTLLAHAKALERVQPNTAFTVQYPHSVDVPAFPTLNAFKPNPHWRMALPVGDAAKLTAAADAVMRKLGTDGKPL